MIDPHLRDVVAATPVRDLVPTRAQARAESLGDRVEIVDALELGVTDSGDRAWVLVVSAGGSSAKRDVVVPGIESAGRFVREPSVASLLHQGVYGAFDVQLFGSGIPEGPVRGLEVDQSNDSVIIDESVMVNL